MSEKRAYFTPGPETTGKLFAALIFGNQDPVSEVSFLVEVSDDGGLLPNLEEVVLSPVEQVCTRTTGYEISGQIKNVQNMAGKLTVDTTVEPPLAMFTEFTQ